MSGFVLWPLKSGRTNSIPCGMSKPSTVDLLDQHQEECRAVDHKAGSLYYTKTYFFPGHVLDLVDPNLF